MDRTIDDHDFEVRPGLGAGRCRAQILRGGDRTLVLLTQQLHDDDDGVSLANAAEDFADALRDRYLPESVGRPGFIARTLLPDQDHTWQDGAFSTLSVTFDADGRPAWGPVDADTLDLLQHHADPGRGTPTPRPARPKEPESSAWSPLPTTLLPRPQRLFRAKCMTHPVWRACSRAAQRVGLRVCGCEYHAVSWSRAAALAVDALRQAHAEGVAGEREIAGRAGDILLEHGPEDRVLAAAQSLLLDPIVLNSELDYTNGQHRSEAILDQHVPLAPVVVSLAYRSAPPLPLFT